MGSEKQAILVLEDATEFCGISIGFEGEVFGEMVFNTSMTGYQEILTDPSYAEQIVCMTYPHIGNYGTNGIDIESRQTWVRGFVVREASKISSNWRAEKTLGAYLTENKIVGIEHIDTRALVRHIRDKGAMRAAISSLEVKPEKLLQRIVESPKMERRELAASVTTRERYDLAATGEARFDVVCIDFGVKTNSLRILAEMGCDLKVLPASATAVEIAALSPDGIFLSNGPGDPAAMTDAVMEIQKLVDLGTPIFGICLGHQLIAKAFGAETYKMKFGHRGANQPIKDLKTGRIEITSHNHGFAVNADSLSPDIDVTHINLNDKTVAGIAHRSKPIFGIQYHPEAAPGPSDGRHHFGRFIESMNEKKGIASFA